uniref:Uncharacterized protein n=1 Tax=Rhizophora mucronata TaxID=61149 RepID=A0A2P2PYQ8_RHIMU
MLYITKSLLQSLK